MKNIFKSFLLLIKNNKIWVFFIGLTILGIILYMIYGGDGDKTPTFAFVEKGNIRQEVSVTGNIRPISDASLSFERGGRLVNLNVSVGDRVYAGQVLAIISNTDLSANLDQAKANLKKTEANFGDNLNQTNLVLNQAKISLSNSIKDSYTKADDALRNKVYSLFINPVKYRARLAFDTDFFLREDLEEGKDDLNNSLESWFRVLSKKDIFLDLENNYLLAKDNLLSLKSLLDKCAEAVNNLSAEDYLPTQTQIDLWKLNISTARTNINLAIDSLESSYNLYTKSDLSVKISQNSLMAEEANIEQAKAQVLLAQAELSKSIIRAPFGGIITNIDAKIGEIVSPNQSIISLISGGNYQIEVFIPEADIAKIKLGNIAQTTLDAYGDGLIFKTSVVKIDPAATFIDGVPTYKVTLSFQEQDERIRAGMTANLDILTAERKNVLTIPTRVVYSRGSNKYVQILNEDNSIIETQIESGLRGSDGRLEILSGLVEGDRVVTNI